MALPSGCISGVRISAVVVILVAILGYFALQSVTFVIKTDIFIRRPPEAVYKGLSDLKNSITYHKHRKEFRVILKEDNKGVTEKVYEITDYVPIYGSWELPITYNATMEFTIPNRELHCDFTINAYGLTGRNSWYLQPGYDKNGPGTDLKEEFHITCPWIASRFTEHTARIAHKALLSNIKVALEQKAI